MAGLLHLQSTFLPSWASSPLRAAASTSRQRRACRVEAKIREIFMPALSSTMTEGKIVSWATAEGDRLAKGDPVVVVESDMDVETFHDGFLAAVLVPAGESAPVGSAIALLAESEDEIPLAQSQAASFSSAPASPPPPQETAAQEASPPPPPPPAQVAPVAVSAPASPSPATQGGARVVASPYAKKLAKDLNVDLFSITGSGPGGRIVAKDVEAAAAAPKKMAPVAAAARPDVPLGSTVPFTTMQGAVSKNMVESLAVPTFRVGYTITTDVLDELYKKIKAKGVTMTALLAKATAMALVQHPVVNSSCRDGKSFTYNSSINIAVAVAIDGGLITPVLQDADKVDIYSLSRKWKELVDKARAKQLQPHEYNSVCTTVGGAWAKMMEEQEQESEPWGGSEVAQLRAKRALVGASARVLFYPMLLYNVLRNRFEAEFRWWDRVDQCILLGAVPFPSDVPRLKQLGVQGVVTLNEPYETLVSTSLYQAHGIDHLVIPTRDYLFAPSPEDICRAMDFIHRNASQGGTTYVHCKAGRGRSTTIVLCYLIKYRSMSPEAALDHVRSIRPRVLLAPSQWQAVNVFSTLTTGRLPIRSTNLNCSLEAGEACITEDNETVDYYTMEFDYEDSGLPLCQVMLPRQTSPSGCIDAVFITEADLEGYDTYVDTGKDVVSLEVVVSRKPIMRRLSCLFGSLKLTSNCEPAPSRFTEVRAC